MGAADQHRPGGTDENDSPQPMFAFAERAAAASPTLAFLVIQAAYHAEDDNGKIRKDARVHRALDVVLRWLGTPAGGGSVYASNDRRWAGYGLVSAGRGAEAVPLFAQLGIDASGRPWENFGDNAIDVFDSFRRRACAAPRTAYWKGPLWIGPTPRT